MVGNLNLYGCSICEIFEGTERVTKLIPFAS